MSQTSVKQLISGALISALVAVQIPLPAYAAVGSDPLTSALAGTSFLAANQSNAGSIGTNNGDTDWSVIALKAAGKNPSTLNNGGGISAVDFMSTDTPTAATSATSIERRIIAVNAIGQDSTNFGGIDYNAKLKSFYNANQIGDPTLLNDDIFGIIAVAASRDSSLEPMAQDSVAFLLSHQLADGGFSYTTNTCDFYCGSDSNDTAAAIIAIDAAASLPLANPGLTAAKDKALAYLLTTQQTDGGFGYDAFSASDGSSTSWGLMALNVTGSSSDTPKLAARNWLLTNQNTDGGFAYGLYGMTSSDASTTAPAILALLGTTWLLNPAPIQVAPPTPPIPASIVPSAAPVAAVSTPAPTSNTAADTSRPVALPTADLAAALAPTTSAPTGEVKGASRTQPALTQSSNTTSKPNTALYGLLVLLAVAAIWHVLQSTTRKKV